MKPLYIFDLDGTLALIEHRQHFVEGSKKDWRGFFAACIHDKPNIPVIRTLQSLRSNGAEIWIFSGRSDEVRVQTLEWLSTYVDPQYHLKMRREGDHKADEVLKREWLNEMSYVDCNRLVAVFDDRDKVVKMWREAGVACFQVAPGDF